MGEEEIAVVEEHKYLGCIVDEHGQCRRMGEERAKAGARALSHWLRRCKASVGEVRGETFRRLLEILVGSVLLYGVEVWGCGRQLGPADESSEDIYGVGRLHPLASLQFEMSEVGGNEKRLLKEVMKEAMKLGSRVKWVKDLRMV